jgi:hypothetical protein
MSAYQVGAAPALTLLPPLLEPPEVVAPLEVPPVLEPASFAAEPPVVEAPLLVPAWPAPGALSLPQPTSALESARQSNVAAVGVKARKAALS